jgi:spermidine/putrescine transport system ATP-binding protein
VMNRGRVEQIGTPREIYDRPASRFVAGFIGHANILPVVVRTVQDGAAEVVLGPLSFRVRAAAPVPPGPGHMALRYERIRVGPELGAARRGRAPIREVVFSGPSVLYVLAVPGGIELVAEAPYDGSAPPYPAGAEIDFAWDEAAPSLFADA